MKVVVPIPISDENIVETNVELGEYHEWDAVTAYRRGRRVAVTDVGVNRVYESLYPNTGMYPPLNTEGEPPAWANTGSTNPLAMFSPIPDLETSQYGLISVDIAPGRDVTAVALFGLKATEVSVQVHDALDNVVFYRSVDMLGPDVMHGESVFVPIPSHPNATIKIRIHNPGKLAVCRTLVLGVVITLGGTRYDLSSSIDDLSEKNTSVFGLTTLEKKGYVKKMRAVINVRNEHVDYVHKQLSELRATPCAWFATDKIRATLIYGFYRDFEIVIQSVSTAQCSMDIQGLYEPFYEDIVPSTYHFTSLTYPLEVFDSMQAESGAVRDSLLWSIGIEKLLPGSRVTAGDLRTLLKRYSDWPLEEMGTVGSTITGGTLIQTFFLRTYTDWPIEEMAVVGSTITGGNLVSYLIRYEKWVQESFQTNGSIVTGGTLE